MRLHLGARWRRFWHTLRGMFSGHLAVTCWDDKGRTIVIGCTCGRSFWVDKAVVLTYPPTKP